jgi:putative membrane protein
VNSADSNAGNKDAMKDNTSTTTPITAKMPLSKADSMFVMKAAAGGMMEVQGGNTAQQNAMSDRVKNYGAMLVADHSKANSELMALASARGLTPPADLPADMKKHLDMMAKMKGKSFDRQYISMMLTDHKKDVADFEKQANGGNDPELKAFAAKTLPVLKMHLDSVQALSKMK